MKLIPLLIALLAAIPVFPEQNTADELQVIQAAIRHHFKVHQPYIKGPVILNHETEALEPASKRFWSESVRAESAEQNTQSLQTSSIVLAQNFIIADVAKYGSAKDFDWKEFGQVYGDAYVLRSSRPTFITDSRAVLRLDIAHSRTGNGRPAPFGYELERRDGTWVVVPGPLVPITERPNS